MNHIIEKTGENSYLSGLDIEICINHQQIKYVNTTYTNCDTKTTSPHFYSHSRTKFLTVPKI